MEDENQDIVFLKENLEGTVPKELAKEIIKNVIEQASMLKVCKRESMTSNTKDLPYLADSGSASWTEEGELIETSVPIFEYPKLKAKKLSVIIPVTNEKMNDSVISVLETLKQAIADAFANAIDKALIFGTDSPFDTNIISSIGDNKIVFTGKIGDCLSDCMGIVEGNKFSCNHILMGLEQKKVLRKLANDNNYKDLISLKEAYDTPIEYVREFDNTKYLAITGDFSKAIIGTREGIQYKVLDQATIKSGDKTIYLAQQDMIAIRATMRIGFVVVDSKAFSMIEPLPDTQ